MDVDERPPSQSTQSVPQHPCGVCGRTFYPDVLARHQRICEKTSTKKRKVFNTQKQRLQGTDMEKAMAEAQFRKKAPSDGVSERKRGHDNSRPIEKKKSNWRSQHEEFIAAIRGAREVTLAMKSGAPLPPPPPPAENPDYVKCEFCERRFKAESAERHIPFCKEKASRLNKNGKTIPPAAQEKLSKRKAYRAPLPGAKKRTSMDGPGAVGQSQAEAYPPTSGRTVPSQQAAVTASGRVAGGQRQAPAAQQDTDRRPGGMARQRPPPGPPTGRTAAASRNGGQQQPPSSQQPQGTRNGQLRRPAQQQAHAQHHLAGSGGRGNSRNGMNSTYTLRQNDVVTPPELDLDGGHAEHYAEHSPAVMSAVPSGRTSARRRLQEATEFEQRQYHSDAYISSAQTPLGRSSSASTSGVSDLSLDASLPPINGSRHPSSGRMAMKANHGSVAGMSKFCYNCGTQFPVPHAKYCCECGTKRLAIPT